MAETEKLKPCQNLQAHMATNEAGTPRQARAEDKTRAKPLIWGLTTSDTDERNQILNLSSALHWPFREKPLSFNSLAGLPNLLLADSPLSLDLAAAPDFRPPWPDFVISSGRQSVPIARWIRRCSGGRSHLIHIGYPRVPLGLFDLVITTREQALPSRHNVLLNAMTLNWVAPEQLCEAACRWSERLVNLPRPRIAVLIDSNESSCILNGQSAGRLAREVAEQALRTGGSLMITAGREPPRDILRIVLDSIPPEVPLDAWLGEGDSPYLAYLAFANRIVVAGRNAATLSEACTTGKPVQLFEPFEPMDLQLRVAGALRNVPGRRTPSWSPFGAMFDHLVELGVIPLSSDTRLFCDNLRAQGVLAPFGESNQLTVAVTRNESICRTVWRVRKLWLEGRSLVPGNNTPPPHGN